MTNKILYVQYSNPAGYPPLEHSSQLIASSGWAVRFLGVGIGGVDTLTLPQHPNIKTSLLRGLEAGVSQRIRYFLFSLWVLSWVVIWRPRWIYASDSLACPIALALTYWPGLKIVYHEHDLPGDRGKHSRRPVLSLCRKRLARRATVCVVPNENRARILKEQTGAAENVKCVWNCPRRPDVAPARSAKANAPMIVHYHGNISPAYVPETLIDALAKTDPAIHLRIVGFEPIGRESHRARLTQRASALGVGDRIQVLSPEPRYRLIERCRQADVGLSFNPACKENFNQEFRASASNKAFEYLASGLALLVTDQPEWRTWFVEPGYGLACDSSDPDSIAGALEWFLHNPAARTAMGESGRQRILADWNYERQFEPVLSMLEGRSD